MVASLVEQKDAFLYGAGTAEIASVVGCSNDESVKLKARFLASLPALELLLSKVKETFETTGSVRGLDGRRLFIASSLDKKAKGRKWTRSTHKALNTLLQSAGAIVMKRALVLLDENLKDSGLIPGVNYEFVINCHDEFQIEVDAKHAEFVGKAARQSIIDAGVYYNLRCPLDGEWKLGNSWAETH